MNIYIVIPAHNEADAIGKTLDSLVKQTHLPKKVIVVNDNSTDNTAEIVSQYTNKHSWIELVNNTSSNKHIPGAKIINAFYKGYEQLDEAYDIICKYDADLVFPNNYLQTLIKHYKADDRLGLVAGHCYIEKNGEWVRESLTGKDHIRGALKAYRKACFLEIGKLKRSMGWDTIDELLAIYYNWSFKTDDSLKVKHLKPTGKNYVKDSKHLHGKSLYILRFGFLLSFISSAKLAYKKRSFRLFKDYITGYLIAWLKKEPFLIDKDQGKFIRKFRWKNILKKIF
ncbi:glycosyltransferase family 2 protein [Pontimicrobium sp. IMCC45349]|uniref:glycosyltransferase family 2 protein n=1 Tax=Pontimicrobium sp. IMCC45349 TaxID=3391574 RepID=UPI0039A1B735